MGEEFSARIECPHCGNEEFECIYFNFMEADQSGCDSGLKKFECFECGKKYWIRAWVNFEVDVHHIYAKKPRGRE